MASETPKCDVLDLFNHFSLQRMQHGYYSLLFNVKVTLSDNRQFIELFDSIFTNTSVFQEAFTLDCFLSTILAVQF